MRPSAAPESAFRLEPGGRQNEAKKNTLHDSVFFF